MKNDQVYIVISYTPYEGSEIDAVFLDEKQANKFAEENKNEYYDYTEVEVYNLMDKELKESK